MSGKSGYPNGYGYDGGRYDRSGNIEANGYSGGGGAAGGSVRDYRPGGYGGFYPEPTIPAQMPVQSPEWSRERADRGRQPHPQPQPSSRPRTREDSTARLHPARDGLHQKETNWYSGSRSRDRDRPEGRSGAGAQAVEGLKMLPTPLDSWTAE